MAGRAQAANLTGMLNQLAETVGTMGQASDWTHQNIRDYSAPDVKDGSYESLSAYANWAQRNGKQEVADKYRALALAQQQKTKKGAYAKQLATRREGIRNLDKGITALTNAISREKPKETVMVDAPAPKPDVGGPRKPFQAAGNGGFRRPPVAPEVRQQIEQEQDNPRIPVLNKRLSDMQAELANRYAALNKFGDENLQYGGLGTEGSEFERTLASEKAAASKAATATAQAEVNLADSSIDLKKKLGEIDFKREQTKYRNAYDEQFARVQEFKMLAKNGDPLAVKLLGEAESQLDELEGDWQEWGDSQTLTGDYTAATYAEKAQKDFNENQARLLELKKKELGVQAAQQSQQQTSADTLAISSAAQMAAEGKFELTTQELKTINPLILPKLQSELERHRGNRDRLETAQADGRVTDDVIAYAQSLQTTQANGVVTSANQAIATALSVYQNINSDTTMTSNAEERRRAAKRLTELTNAHRDTASTNQEAVAKSASVASYTNMWREYSRDRAFTDDLMDDINDENLGEFNSYIETFMAIDGSSTIQGNEAYTRYAVMARDAMGLQTDNTNLGEVIDMQDTAQVFAETVGEVAEAEYQRILKEEPLINEAAARRRSSQVASTLVVDMQKFLNIDANQQQQQLQNELNSLNNKDTRFPPRFINLFNGAEGAKTVIKWMKNHPGQQYSYKGFQEGDDA